MPAFENGRLKFTDSTHFTGYLEYLSEEIIDNDSSGTSAHEKLEAIEQGMSFTSLRHISKASWDSAALIGWNTFEEIPEEHFITSVLVRSVLNEMAEVQVGDRIIHFVNADFAVSLAETAYGALDSVRSLSVTSTEVDIDAITSGHVDRDIIFNTKREVGFVDAIPLGGGARVELKAPIVGNDCGQPYVARLPEFWLLDGLDHTIKYKANFIVDWGDGSPHEGVVNKTIVKNLTHTYPGPGTYKITILGSSLAPALVGSGGATVEIKSCTNPSNEFETHWAVDGNQNYVIRGKCWLQQFTRKFGGDKLTTGASTKAFWKNSAGKWKPWLAYAVYVNYSVQKHNTDCTGNWNGSGGDYKTSKTEVITEYTQGGHVSWDPMLSKHYIYIHNQNDIRTYSQTMDHCN